MKHSLTGIILMMGGMLSLVGCKDEDLGSNYGNLTISAVTQNSAKLQWQLSPVASGYKISLGEGLDEIVVNGQNTTEYMLSNLSPSTKYEILLKRIRSVGGGEEQWGSGNFTTLGDFMEIRNDEVTDKTVVVRRKGGEFTAYRVFDDANAQVGEDRKVESDAVTIKDLTPATHYTIYAMYGDKERGRISVTTCPNYGEKTIFAKSVEEFVKAVENEENADGVVCLYGGKDYKLPNEGSPSSVGSVTIPASITLIAADVNGERPVVNGYLSCAGTFSANHIEFKGGEDSRFFLSLTGGAGASLKDVKVEGFTDGFISYENGEEPASIQLTDCYLSNLSSTTNLFNIVAVGKDKPTVLSLQNCAISDCSGTNFLGFQRASQQQGNDSIVVKNCSFYNIGCTNFFYFTNNAGNNAIEPQWSSTIFANSTCSWGHEFSKTKFTDNNYFEVSSLISSSWTEGKEYSTEDPMFSDPQNNDLTINNETLKEHNIGAYLNFK